jgi:flagellar biosynthesis protein FlhG
MKSLAISSGKGGVGKTTVTVNLGLALASMGKRVLLVDADLGLANIDILAGISVRRSLADTVDGSASLLDVLVDVAPGVRLLPASSGVLKLERLTVDHRLEIASQIHGLSGLFDVMLFDTGAGLTENVLFFDSIADEVLVVTTPEPTAITDSYALIKVLATHCQVKDISLLVNRSDSAAQGSETHRKLADVCQKFLNKSVAYAGTINKDRAAEHAVRERIPFVISNRACAASSGIFALASRFDQLFTAPSRELVTPSVVITPRSVSERAAAAPAP